MNSLFHSGVGRKFIAIMTVQLLDMVLLGFGKLDNSTYQVLTIFLMGFFVAGNVGAKAVDAYKTKTGVS